MTQQSRPSPRQFDTELELSASPEAVWAAISEARENERWFAPRAEVVPGVGGRMLWSWGEAHSWPLEIEVWEPQKHLRARYASQVDDGRGGQVPIFVDFHVEGAGGKTKLRLVHSGFGPEASFDQEYDGISRGWPVELTSLRHYVERHLGQERAVAWSIGKPSSTPDAAWTALCAAIGDLDAARAGERIALRFGPGAAIEGRCLRTGQREITVDADGLGDGFLRIGVESCTGELQVWLWLALWGRPQDETERFQQAFDALVARLFAPAKQGSQPIGAKA
jgi:uncharacterized protein YndB with AHSA1/START domain